MGGRVQAALLALGMLCCVEARPSPSKPTATYPPGRPALLADLGDARLTAQVQRVIESMDGTGRPPQDVAQGGRRHGPKGVFANAQGRLPARPPGYYRESDVWPRGPGGRGAQRLVFGEAGEVFYTADHYATFVRLR
jgi:guanyl-specific ribonuclease Sa